MPESQIDDAALRMCRLILRTGALDGGRPPSGELRTARHRQIAEDAAVEAVVLLKNASELLPLTPATLSSLAVVGPNAAARRIQGGGSSQVRTDRRVSILSALPERLAGRARCCTPTAATTSRSRPPRGRRCSARTGARPGRHDCASTSPVADCDGEPVSTAP